LTVEQNLTVCDVMTKAVAEYMERIKEFSRMEDLGDA
jgi:hypothetical protein